MRLRQLCSTCSLRMVVWLLPTKKEDLGAGSRCSYPVKLEELGEIGGRWACGTGWDGVGWWRGYADDKRYGGTPWF